ncbi:MAG: ThiF family adenylyltransferase [Flavobacteriales bacterium]
MASGYSDRERTTIRIAVVGAGGIGNAILPLLATLPLGKLSIIDGDRVELKNIERQPLFTAVDVGQFKASTLADRFRRTLIGCVVMAHDVFLDAQNAHDLLNEHDVVLEGVDDLHAKTLVDRVCLTSRIPLVSGGVHGQQGQVIVLHMPRAGEELTRAQLFSGPYGAEQDGCDMRDVPLALLDEVGACMIARVRDLLGGKPFVNGRMELLESPGHPWMIIEPVS